MLSTFESGKEREKASFRFPPTSGLSILKLKIKTVHFQRTIATSCENGNSTCFAGRSDKQRLCFCCAPNLMQGSFLKPEKGKLILRRLMHSLLLLFFKEYYYFSSSKFRHAEGGHLPSVFCASSGGVFKSFQQLYFHRSPKSHGHSCLAKEGSTFWLPISDDRQLSAIAKGIFRKDFSGYWNRLCQEPIPAPTLHLAVFFFVAKRSIITNSFCSRWSRLIMMSVSSLFIFAHCLFIDQAGAIPKELFCSYKVLSSDWSSGAT